MSLDKLQNIHCHERARYEFLSGLSLMGGGWNNLESLFLLYPIICSGLGNGKVGLYVGIIGGN